MKRFPIPSALNALVVAAHLAGFAACLFWCAKADSWPSRLGLMFVFALLMNAVYAAVHEAEHGLLLRNRRLNDAVGIGLALLFPAPFHLIRQTHLGHHQRNRSDDEAFDLYFPEDNRLWRGLMYYGILLGFFYWLIPATGLLVLLVPGVEKWKVWRKDRPSAALLDSLNPAYWRFIRIETLLAVLLHGGLIVGLRLPAWNYLLMYAAFGWMWSAMQYVHHYETERDVLEGSRNLRIFGPLDWFWLNHNWHREHHRRPTVPWPYLHRLGQEHPRKPGNLVWAYLRMWRGPRMTHERVENRYAGRIIR